MSLQIINEKLAVSFSKHGAELISVVNQEANLEYIWQADPQFWNRHAPVLFPFVGRLKDDRYYYAEKAYSMGQHGFARDFEFVVVDQLADKIVFELNSDEKTNKVYPFDFKLQLSFALKDDVLTVGYEVKNTGTEQMYFSIGGHPAFNVPLEPKLAFEDYEIELLPTEERNQIPLVGPYSDPNDKKPLKWQSLPLQYALFDKDAIIVETPTLASFSIKSKKGEHGLTLSYDNMAYTGLWSPPGKKAPFVCIEPWLGIADTVGTSQELTQKLGILQLEAGNVFKNEYTIHFF